MLHYLYINENEKHIMETAVFEKVCDLSREKLAKKDLDCILNLTAYYQALGKALQSLLITMLRNVILFILGVIILNSLFGLKGTIAAQPVVETILAIVCLIMYIFSKRRLK